MVDSSFIRETMSHFLSECVWGDSEVSRFLWILDLVLIPRKGLTPTSTNYQLVISLRVYGLLLWLSRLLFL